MCSNICAPFLPNFSLGVLNPHVLICGFLLYQIHKINTAAITADQWKLAFEAVKKQFEPDNLPEQR